MNYDRQQLILCSLGGLAIVASLVISILIVSNTASEAVTLRETLWRGAAEARLSRAFSVINDFPGSAGKDLLYLRTLSSEKSIHDFLLSRGVYDAMYRFDTRGACRVGVTVSEDGEDESGCGPISPDMQMTVERAQMLAPGEVYVSPLMLHGKTPALLYSTVFKGEISVSIVHADYFLEDIRRLSRDGEAVFLLQSDGAYLAHAEKTKEKYFGGTTTFYQDFPEVPGDALADVALKRFESDKAIFTFWRIYPTESNFSVYEGANTIFGPKRSEQYFWVMVAVSEKPAEKAGASLPSMAGLIASHLLVGFLLYFLLVRRSSIHPYEQ